MLAKSTYASGITPSNLNLITNYIYSYTGHNISIYKLPFIHRCINNRINSTYVADVNDYIELLRSNHNEILGLLKLFMIRVTQFFRDTHVFNLLINDVVPRLMQNKFHERSIRIWIPGCCTGEEAYSFAMIIHHYMEKMGVLYDVKIFATDIDPESLKKANTGIYNNDAASTIDKEWLNKYFIKAVDGYQITQKIRNMVVFGYHDLINQPPFTKMDLISCRNLLIYIDEKKQAILPPLFHHSLCENGILVLGTSESIQNLEKYFNPISLKSKIFCKNNQNSLVQAFLNFPTKH